MQSRGAASPHGFGLTSGGERGSRTGSHGRGRRGWSPGQPSQEIFPGPKGRFQRASPEGSASQGPCPGPYLGQTNHVHAYSHPAPSPESSSGSHEIGENRRATSDGEQTGKTASVLPPERAAGTRRRRVQHHRCLPSKPPSWASLVAQWLRICLPMQGTRVRAPVRKSTTCHRATRPVSHSY